MGTMKLYSGTAPSIHTVSGVKKVEMAVGDGRSRYLIAAGLGATDPSMVSLMFECRTTQFDIQPLTLNNEEVSEILRYFA